MTVSFCRSAPGGQGAIAPRRMKSQKSSLGKWTQGEGGSPVRTRATVVFPAPGGPVSTMISPAAVGATG
jgi:hypothetical protein